MPVAGEKSERFKLRQQRMKTINELTAIKRVRVTPKNDELRGLLMHPSGLRLRKEGSTEWPHDSFTKRRVRDGDITIEEQSATPQQTQTRPAGAGAARHTAETSRAS
jgi:hypothetical protein